MTRERLKKYAEDYAKQAKRAEQKYNEHGNPRHFREKQYWGELAEAFDLAAEAVEEIQKYRALKAELLYLACRADRAIEIPDITSMGGVLESVIVAAKVYAGYKPIERMDGNDG